MQEEKAMQESNSFGPLVALAMKKFCGKIRRERKEGEKPFLQRKGLLIEHQELNRTYTLARLGNREFFDLKRESITLEEDYGFILHLMRCKDLIYSDFAKMYAIMRNFFGKSGKFYDDWKGSFSFPFLIHFKENEEDHFYIMNVFNLKTAINLRMYKLVSKNENLRKDIYHEYSKDFKKENMHYLVNYFLGYLTGFFPYFEMRYYREFVKKVDSEFIIFGFYKGNFFNVEYDDEEDFADKYNKILKTIKERRCLCRKKRNIKNKKNLMSKILSLNLKTPYKDIAKILKDLKGNQIKILYEKALDIHDMEELKKYLKNGDKK